MSPSSHLPNGLLGYVPRIVVRRLLDDPTPIPVPTADHTSGVCLFLDISGFTPLTERLAEQGPLGAEQMGAILAESMGLFVDIAASHGGEVIDFAGDAALVVWWDSGDLTETARRAAGCAVVLRAATATDIDVHGTSTIEIKVLITAGPLVVAHLGGVDGAKRCVVAGAPLLELSELEAHAVPGGIVLSRAAADLLERSVRTERLPDGAARLLDLTVKVEPVGLPPLTLPPEAESAIREYIQPAVAARLGSEDDEWLAEFRRCTSVFVNLIGVHYDEPEEIARLQAATAAIQLVAHRFGGTVHQFMEGDKGTMLLAVFGLPPTAHEDDAERGVMAALDIEAAAADAGYRSAVGITTGTVFCGPVGGRSRREYAVIGDSVNLAARLMQAATDDILCEVATVRSTHRIRYDDLAPIGVKGKEAPVPVFRPVGVETAEEAVAAGRLPIIGRTEQRTRITALLDGLGHGAGGDTLLIEGEAGIGKSRLLEFAVEAAEERDIRVLRGSAGSVEQSSAYFAWRPIVAAILSLHEAPEDPGGRRRHVLRWLRSNGQPIDDAALLNGILEVQLPESPAVTGLSDQDRAARTRELLAGLLSSGSAEGPLLIAIEDGQWMDSASWDLAVAVAERPETLLVLSTRPATDVMPSGWTTLLARAHRLTLEPMESEAIRELVRRVLGVDDVPAAVDRFITERGEGHPFYSEELALALRDSGAVVVEGGVGQIEASSDAFHHLVPDTIQGVVVSRIDRLEPRLQMILKSASVLGRVFEPPIVSAIDPGGSDRPVDADDLLELQRRGLIEPEPGSAGTFRFRHAITRDVAYESLPHAKRRRLHHLAAGLLEDQPQPPRHSVLAHHWLAAVGDPDEDATALLKAEHHLVEAGLEALRQGALIEAAAVLGDALGCEERLPTRLQDPHRELGILQHLGTATFAASGFGSPRTREIYGRTYELARDLVKGPELFPMLWGLWLATHFSGDPTEAIRLGERLLEIADDEDDDELRLQAHHALWTTLMLVPDYERARRHLDEGRSLYRSEWHERHSAEFGGHDPGACAERALCLTLWATGSPDRALEAGSAGIRLAKDHHFSLISSMLALAFVHHERGDADAATAQARELREIAAEHGYHGVVGWASIIEGWAEGIRGDIADGIATIEDAASDLGVRDPGYLAMLVDLFLRGGHTSDGLALADELLGVIEDTHQRSHEPEMCRLKGELLVAMGDIEGGEEWFRRSLESAAAQGARSFELRTVTSMARVAQGTEHEREAIVRLRDVYNGFTEGFDTPDLVDAQRLLSNTQ